MTVLTPTLTLPSNFTLVYYRFTLQAIEEMHLPANKGSALRGGFGHTFKRLVCSQPWTCGKECKIGNTCPYGYIFETAPPEGSQRLRLNSNVPRPFIIEPPRDRRNHILPNEQLSFGLILVGQAMNYFPHFLAVFRELGWAGLGRTRGQYRVVSIDAISPYDGQVEVVFHRDNPVVHITQLTPNSAYFTHHAQNLPGDKIRLEFLTPTGLKHNGWLAEAGPPFFLLVKALLGRLSSLSYFHCGQALEVDFKGLIEAAKAIQFTDVRTRWTDWSRFSGRQKQRIDMSGLMGEVTYTGNLSPYLDLLALGELIHVGKGTVFGNGQYQIMRK